MASTIQIYAPDPNAPPEEYARAVTASIQDLVAGRRPRDPALSGASTGRLIFEGLVESVKVYRLYQQEKMSRVEETKGNRRDGRRHRRSNDEGGSHNRVRHCKSRPTKQHDGGDVSDDYEQERDQRTYHSPEDNPELHLTRHLMSGALHAAESALGFGPDGTPFGSLPTRGKGTGWLPHVKAVHRHIRAEQDAGLRSKGLAEKCIVDFLQKRRAAQSVEKDRGKEPVVEETGGEGDEGSGRGGNRSWKPRKRRGERQAGSNERALPRSGGNTPSGEQEVHPPSQAEEFVQQPALSARSVPPQVQPSIEESRIHHNREGGAAVEEENAFAEARTGTPCVPVVRFQSPKPPRQLTSIRLPTPQGGHKSHGSDDVVRESVEGSVSRDAPCTPVVPIRSLTPPRQRTPGRLMTPQGSHKSHDREGVVVSAEEKTAEERMAVESSIEMSGSQAGPDVRIVRTQSFAASEEMAPVRSPTPASQVTLISSPAPSYPASNSSLLPMFLLNEESAIRPIEAHIEHSHLEAPVYEATPHSTNVEALEHAQAVEEMEGRHEIEGACRTNTPLTPPQPKVALPIGFEAGLVAKAHLVNLTKQDDGGLPKTPEHLKSPRAEREIKDNSFKPGDGDLIDLRSDRSPSSDSWTNRDAGTRKLIWRQEPDWNFDNLKKQTQT